ncbi:MAG TPA: hypothetical protein VMI75_39550 [Polyangiaceae bacterium]|nr:hypothetical protein [Polyangiaceae bacterium]
MEEEEKQRLRREILDDVGALLRGELAAEAWGRVLVEVVRGDDGEPVVAGVDVEDIVGDEAAVDAAFADDHVRPLLPVLAKATEALCGLEGVALEDVRGGTFLRRVEGDFAWLPGLVHMPSAALEKAWDEVTAALRTKQASLEERFAIRTHDRYDADLEHEEIVYSRGGVPRVRAKATLVGTLSLAARTWAWGGGNENLSPAIRASSAALVDGILERDLWELSTPVFALDEPTAWALCAFVCDRTGGAGLWCYENRGGLVFLLLRDVKECAGSA